jgi:CheY-like chemotaxis protein
MTDLKKIHIIIAEDDADDGEIILESFSKHASFIKIDWVKNGIELLNMLKNNKGIRPDVILTDINMPILNGIEALEEIYADPDLKHIPAFVYSSAINPVYEAKCKELGTKGFLIKPFKLSDFYNIPYHIVNVLQQEKRNK